MRRRWRPGALLVWLLACVPATRCVRPQAGLHAVSVRPRPAAAGCLRRSPHGDRRTTAVADAHREARASAGQGTNPLVCDACLCLRVDSTNGIRSLSLSLSLALSLSLSLSLSCERAVCRTTDQDAAMAANAASWHILAEHFQQVMTAPGARPSACLHCRHACTLVYQSLCTVP